MSGNLISIDDLSIAFGRDDELTEVVHNVSFGIAAGEKLALVGESGSGKSVTALSILGLHDRSQSRYPSGKIMFENRDLLALGEGELRSVRGADIAMIFQEPMTALNPVYPVGKQLIEPLIVHRNMEKVTARKRMIELLDRTGIKEPHKRIDAYPHMLSGGQRQRVMIAMALACNPKLLIADEPTTALDVTIQVQILELLEDIQQEFGMAVLMITHDLNMVRRFAQRVCVMQNGKLVETAAIEPLFESPQHPYTKQLLASQPQRIVEAISETELQQRRTIIESDSLKCYFPIKAGFFQRQIGEVKAVDEISINLHKGETLGIVGESGSGKTTLGMCLLRLQSCEGGIRFQGKDIQQLSERDMRPVRRHMQVVFQDPFSSLSPRMTIEQILGEGLRIHFPDLDTGARREKIVSVLNEVDLEEDMLWRYPHEFSGGQRQRIAIARAVVLEPDLMLLDEPTSALDVSVQKQVLDLLARLQKTHGIAYLFITHDLNVIRAMAHRVLVMRGGRVIESGDTESLFTAPQQEYTRTLLSASLFTQNQ
ncbi:MAG: ABC transporter ATP-binding protein [Acidiferrobacterales bacterium]|jgi:microcin C transport system ATP-binding protein|nr:ABC transporter ATP-binding protein [Acidiferrobacterales bacterium]